MPETSEPSTNLDPVIDDAELTDMKTDGPMSRTGFRVVVVALGGDVDQVSRTAA